MTAGPRALDYPEAEALVERLAERLIACCGAEVRSARFLAIPRGGLIVLGLLAYALRLDREAVDAGARRDAGLTVIVDDCALTGTRFASTLAAVPAGDVVFAHLLSHPDLRRAIVDREPRVLHCVAAADLETRTGAPEREEAHRRRWLERLGKGAYWTGDLAPIAFPWSQPERLAWNEEERRIEGGWRVWSPRRSFASRIELGLPSAAPEPGEYDLATDVAWKVGDDGLHLLRWRDGRRFLLGELEVAMLRALLTSRDRPAGIEGLAADYGVEVERVARDLERFAAELVAEGLLE